MLLGNLVKMELELKDLTVINQEIQLLVNILVVIEVHMIAVMIVMIAMIVIMIEGIGMIDMSEDHMTDLMVEEVVVDTNVTILHVGDMKWIILGQTDTNVVTVVIIHHTVAVKEDLLDPIHRYYIKSNFKSIAAFNKFNRKQVLKSQCIRTTSQIIIKNQYQELSDNYQYFQAIYFI